MRVVLDTNVLISAVISRQGSPGQILRSWEEGAFDLLISSPILEELERVIHYPRIQQRYHLSEEYVGKFLESLHTQAILVNPQMELEIIAEDPTDNRYLECAAAGRATCIVTGDSHLLNLKTYEGIAILNPAGFLVASRNDSR